MHGRLCVLLAALAINEIRAQCVCQSEVEVDMDRVFWAGPVADGDLQGCLISLILLFLSYRRPGSRLPAEQ